MKPLVIVIADSATADQGDISVWQGLAALGEVRCFPRMTPTEVVQKCQDADAVLTNKVLFDAAVLSHLPKLRYLGVTATGTNVVDLPEAARRGIVITNVPSYTHTSVAQMVLALVLHFTQGVSIHSQRVKAGDWARAKDFCFLVQPIHELAGKRALILGLGTIGQAVSRGFEALGMQVLAATVPGSAPKAGRVSLETALPDADVVTLHCPLTAATREMVDAGFLARMKPGAILINTARGGLVDENALVATLKSGRLLGVGLDVLSVEPPKPHHPLLDPNASYADRVVVTPHIAWATDQARGRLVSESVANVLAWARGEARNQVA
ncbi:MAG: D-2-hydroxyacid dehydrogenase [Myxococcaceae bacterium]